MAWPFDLNGELARIGRDARMQVGARRQSQRLLLALAVHPDQGSSGANRRSWNVGQRSAMREAEIGCAVYRATENTIYHWNGRSSHGQPSQVKRRREQRTCPSVDDVSGRR